MSTDREKSEKETGLSPDRRKLLKAGAVMALAPILAGGFSVLPACAQALSYDVGGRKVLVVSSSPRKDENAELLCDEFMKGAREAGHQTEKIRLVERNIHHCTGCCACMGGQGYCVQDDDMEEVMKQVLAADVLVLAGPVSFRSYNGRMKNFIDRICPIYPDINNKVIYVITSASGGQDEVDSFVRNMRVFTACLHGNTEKSVISATGVGHPGKVVGTPAMRQAYLAGKSA